MPWAKFSEGLRPDPPDLKDVIKELNSSQIFWVVRNGINMTGMPGFNLVEAPDQEIWTIVAFVKKLPTVSEADYKAWTTDAAPPSGKARRPSSAGSRPSGCSCPEPTTSIGLGTKLTATAWGKDPF